MKGLTREQYGALLELDALNAIGLLVAKTKTDIGTSLMARGLIGVEARTCRCGVSHGDCLVISPLGRTAMRCYDIEHRALDIGGM